MSWPYIAIKGLYALKHHSTNLKKNCSTPIFFCLFCSAAQSTCLFCLMVNRALN